MHGDHDLSLMIPRSAYREVAAENDALRARVAALEAADTRTAARIRLEHKVEVYEALVSKVLRAAYGFDTEFAKTIQHMCNEAGRELAADRIE